MGKKNKKISIESSMNVDVSLIMSDIKKKARDRQMEEDIKKLSSINLKDISLDNNDFDDINISEEDENICDNLSYINRNYSLTDKYNFVSTHRKGFSGKIVAKIISKLFLAVKIFIDRLIVAQEAFNVRVVRLFNRFSKDLQKKIDDQKLIDEKLQKCLEERKAVDEELEKRLEERKAVDEELEKRLEERKAVDEELEKRLEIESQRADSFLGQIIENNKNIEDKIEIAKKELQYPSLEIDYKKFEDCFRGNQKEILDRQSQYLRFFHECKNVMDIGCGRGEFIEFLHSNGTGAFGVETDSMMVAECKRKKLNVVHSDVVSYLEEQISRKKPDNIDGIFAAQVVEHLHMDYVIKMLKLCYEILQNGKFIVLETINVKSLATFTNSVYLDPTHVKPIHPETLKFLIESVGFKFDGFIFSSEFKSHEKLEIIPENTLQDKIYNKNVVLLNELLFAPQDYAIIAKK